MPVLIRKLTRSDIEPCAKLFHDTVHAINAKDYTQAQLDAWAPEKMDADNDRWQSLLNNISFVAECDNKIVGFMDMTHEGYLDHAYVHKNHQGKGVASALYRTLEQQAIALGLTEIFTEASITAKPHAEAKGFKVCKEQRKVVNGIELVNYVMKKSLINKPNATEKYNLKIQFLADCKEHIPTLAKLWYEEISRHFAPNPSVERAINNLENHSNKNKMPIAYVALCDEKPVGLACLRENDGIREGTGPWLGSLVVDPAYRRQKIGESLISHVKQEAKKLGYSSLYLLAFDPSIPQWYAKLGWAMIGDDQLFGRRVTVMSIDL